MPDAWQFIGLDTLTVQEDPTEIPEIPAADFISISATVTSATSDLYEALIRQVQRRWTSPERPGRCVDGFPTPEGSAKIPLKDGSGAEPGDRPGRRSAVVGGSCSGSPQ